jgi:hypothetical protein
MSEVAGLNPGLLRLWQWLPGALTIRLDLIQSRLDLIQIRLDLIQIRLDLIQSRLALIQSRPDLFHRKVTC